MRLAHFKKFEPAHFEQYDAPARQATKDWLAQRGWKIYDSPDPYWVDLIGIKAGMAHHIEVEVKVSWQGHNFPYPNIHIAGRKKKFINGRHIHITFNNDLTYALVIRDDSWQQATEIIKDTIHSRGETFIEIPTTAAELYKTKEN